MNNFLDMFGNMKLTMKRKGAAGGATRKSGLLPLLLIMIMCLSLSGCGRKNVTGQDIAGEAAATASTFEFELENAETEAAAAQNDLSLSNVTTESGTDKASEVGNQSSSGTGTDDQLTSGIQTGDETSDNSSPSTESLLDEDGSYTTKEDVALYIHTYGKLPSNFITKKQAKKLGWTGGSLEEFAPGKCIGGDYFGNYEGLLPEDRDYRECDIDTLGRKKRGAKRIIYSDDGYIYYTGDHYESFELLYEPG